MKKFCFFTTVVLLVCCSGNITAQTTQAPSNALESMKQFLGSWQAVAGKDTIELWECQQYGKAFIINVSNIIKGQKSPLYVNNVGFDTRDGKVKGYALWPNGDYITWIAVFDPVNKLQGELMDSFAPGTAWGKFEMAIVNPKEWNWKHSDMNGKIIDELKFSKTK
jgi:hypothetical protein